MSTSKGWVWVALAMFLGACGELRVASGNTSETPNTVAGVLVDPSGDPRIGDTVILRPARWITSGVEAGSATSSLSVRTTVTDSQGKWSVSGMESGAWVVECRGGKLGRLTEAVTVGWDASMIQPRSDTVFPKGRVRGAFAPGTFPKGARGRVDIYGTDLGGLVDSLGAFELRDVPSGPMRLVARFESDSLRARAEDAFELSPRDTLPARSLVPSGFWEEDYDLWPHRKAGRLRFSGSGGFVLESSQDNVPILVRLEGEPVSPMDRTGSSLRFTDGGGTHLPYEIEKWDPVRRVAHVWVKLRHTSKRSDTQGLMVYWGLPETPDWSEGSMVFDTADGWVGVWHFSGKDPLRDVTSNGLRLSGTGFESVEGVAGQGLRLQPRSRLEVAVPQATGTGFSVVSAWVRPEEVGQDGLVARLVDATSGDLGWALRIGDSSGIRRAAFQTSRHGSTEFPTSTTLPWKPSDWFHLGGYLEATRDWPRLRLLVDSVMATEQHFDSLRIPSDQARLQIGGGWSGVLDELRLRRNLRHPDVMRMEWGTGRPEAAVVWWED
ncbi:MAG: DUF2341 domain-containing protein [Fibrobacteria bacterium]|nr:DUF2341 domain-containing protein [Fibrobacteria bacterium]